MKWIKIMIKVKELKDNAIIDYTTLSEQSIKSLLIDKIIEKYNDMMVRINGPIFLYIDNNRLVYSLSICE
jgi:hypothetical protein